MKNTEENIKKAFKKALCFHHLEMISDNILTKFFFPRWMDVIRSDDFIGWTQWSTKMKRLDIFSYCFLPVCISPFSAFSHDPNNHSFSFCHLQVGELFFSCTNEKVSFTLHQGNASLFPKPRPLCSSGNWSREGGNEWSDLSFSSSHPTHPMEESKEERKACGHCYSPLLAYDCRLLQRTSHLQIPPR